MNVKDLIEELQKLDPNLQVILQKDSEGNGYSPCSGLEKAIYLPENTWSGTVLDVSHTADDCCMEQEEWDEIRSDKSKRCVVIYPIN